MDKIINPAQAASAYSNMSKTIEAPGMDTGKKESFGDVLRNTALSSIETLREGEKMSAKAVSGEATLPEVVQAVTSSEVTLQTVMAVRDRLVGAYQEIMRMPV